ncbi:MAG: hypothetical protein MUF64_24075 [Polyangiaceae bacterium]|nr:hypothetical protein [Polyangiaceae bacterium]
METSVKQRQTVGGRGMLTLLVLVTMGLVATGCCGRVKGMLSKKGAAGTSSPIALPGIGAPAGPQAAPGPVTLTFDGGTITGFTISTGGKGRVLTFDKEGRMMVTFEGLPNGTKVQANSEQAEVSGGRTAQVRPDIRAAIGAGTIELGSNFDPKISLTVTLPDGRVGTAAVPPQRMNSFSLGQFLEATAGQGVVFEGEPKDAKRDTAYLTYAGGRILGRKAPIREIDVVATLKKGAQKGTKNCSGYKSKDGSVRSVTLELFEGQAIAYDRRTGAEIARKTLAPNTTCPMTLFQAKDDPTADSNLPSTAAEAWVKTLLR